MHFIPAASPQHHVDYFCINQAYVVSAEHESGCIGLEEVAWLTWVRLIREWRYLHSGAIASKVGIVVQCALRKTRTQGTRQNCGWPARRRLVSVKSPIQNSRLPYRAQHGPILCFPDQTTTNKNEVYSTRNITYWFV